LVANIIDFFSLSVFVQITPVLLKLFFVFCSDSPRVILKRKQREKTTKRREFDQNDRYSQREKTRQRATSAPTDMATNLLWKYKEPKQQCGSFSMIE